MSQGIRRTCHNCYSVKDYDSKLHYCRKCGWKAENYGGQTQLPLNPSPSATEPQSRL